MKKKIRMNEQDYFFALEDGGGVITFDFINQLFYVFAKNETERAKILGFLRNCPYKLPVSEDCSNLEIIKLKRNYYSSQGMLIGRKLIIELYKKIDFNNYNLIAIKNLVNIVDEELTSGDRKIIRDIALKNFRECLEISSDNTSSKKGNLKMCLETDRNATAVNELEKYGFKLNLEKDHKYFIIYR